ncbi:hypothetical protein BT93_G0047 [Corymbia citriodora subsp. variegata]|nr:hypothetical protein BT93_G0047 [Corymbia citriodora subsp. variegata]
MQSFIVHLSDPKNKLIRLNLVTKGRVPMKRGKKTAPPPGRSSSSLGRTIAKGPVRQIVGVAAPPVVDAVQGWAEGKAPPPKEEAKPAPEDEKRKEEGSNPPQKGQKG